MSETVHSTFTVERTYPVAPSAVFAAWADQRTKARWMAGTPDADHELDFRVGGLEVARARPEGVPALTFTSTYQDIVADERIVYSSTMHAEGPGVTTVSVTSVELEEVAEGTRLVLTEHGVFLDGHEEPSWRERGPTLQLDALGEALS